MILAVDVGNTNINFALIDKEGKIIRKYSTSSAKMEVWRSQRNKVDKIIIVSVVPRTLKKIESILRKTFKNAKILVVGRNIKVPLKCEYNKREIGQDRLITAFSAKLLYCLPILIVDFGTAVTFDAVSKKGTYVGGLILPGIKMSLESLSERTAKLPKTYLKKTHSFIGKDTRSSIRNGMIYGYSSICEGLIKRFKKELGKNMRVIATGGDANLISKYTPSMKKVDADLSLKGLYLLLIKSFLLRQRRTS